MTDPRTFDDISDGAIDCPRCGPGARCKEVAWDMDGVPAAVLCLGCREIYGVEVEWGGGPSAEA